ncbi:MAG: ectonucleotide pyrophosphatase/phosphodiesterase [Leptospira sp.]|nr:ectonucleotide pyrophosphatase/phosphodiesterase [Leptospira sp.]
MNIYRKGMRTKVIVLSIDGFLGSYFEDEQITKLIPNLKKFAEQSAFSHTVESVDPTVTYPSHTSMVTGKDPGVHGIFNNTLLDPFETNDGGWMWYAEDIRVKTLWSIAYEKKLKVGNVFWPVTVGADITYNLPQYWRKKIPEDDKLLRALSTNSLHRNAEKAVGSPLNDITKDNVKFATAVWMFETYEPDLMFVYTTDLDTTHHGYGTFSEKAKNKLIEIDHLFGEFIAKIRLYERNDIALILISDHGFASANKICAPNLYLLKKGLIHPEKQQFEFIFKSSGGSAILLPGSSKPTPLELKQIGQDLMMECPGSIFETNLENSTLGSQHPNALAWLRTEEGLYFSGTRKGEIFTTPNPSIFGHGYDKRLANMKTIGGIYFKGIRDKEAWKMTSVKDVFHRACNLLSLNCRSNLN